MSRKEKAQQLIGAIKALSKQNPTRTLNELRILIGLERVVARLESHSILQDHLVFKGGFVLLKNFNSPRFTRDLDALARGLTKTKFKKLTLEALERDLEDGLWYGDIHFDELMLQGGEGGLRISFAFQIGDPPSEIKKIKKLSRLHLDLSFENPSDQFKNEKMESIVEGAAPISWIVYPIEFIVAEKLEALLSRGSTNSRAKDVFDLNLLLPRIKNKPVLIKTIERIFKKRPTPLPESFMDTVSKFDLNLMKSAWMSVEIDIKKEPFETHWAQLLENLKKIS